MKYNRYIAIGTLLLVVTVAGAWTVDRSTPSPALLPPGQPAVRDVHARCPGAKSPCTTCHPDATSSRWASDRLVPAMAVCESCHPEVKGATPVTPVTSACRKCHSDLGPAGKPVRGRYSRPNIRFSHTAHQQVADCKTCHPRAAARQPSPPHQDVVPMRACFTCHRTQGAPTGCRTCHLVEKDGRMVTQLGGRKLQPPVWLIGPNHGPTWHQNHAPTAGRESSLCASCHVDAFCQNCHTGALRPRKTHPGDWLRSHGVSSRLERPNCRNCHRKQSFCLTCHRRSGVAPDSPAESLTFRGQGRYHGTRTPREICRRARHDIGSCVSCHSERSCTSCHANARYNPHPPGFKNRCRKLASRNRRVCTKCHTNQPWNRCK